MIATANILAEVFTLSRGYRFFGFVNNDHVGRDVEKSIPIPRSSIDSINLAAA